MQRHTMEAAGGNVIHLPMELLLGEDGEGQNWVGREQARGRFEPRRGVEMAAEPAAESDTPSQATEPLRGPPGFSPCKTEGPNLR